jgi:hypothetical protein
MINPTIGRVVWYRPGAHETNLASDQPLAAIITYVHSDDKINLVVFGKGGDCHRRASVPLWNGEGDAPTIVHAEWMPYQKGQAEKTEEAEAKSKAADGDVTKWSLSGETPNSHYESISREVEALPSAPVDPDPYASDVSHD